MTDRRSYVGELEWALDQIRLAQHDRNPDRAAQIEGILEYANKVAIARRGRDPMPDRPDRKSMV